jgi:large subunit ribosomal protein L22
MEAKAKLMGVRLSPQKAKLVVDLVRGKSVSEALDILAFTNKSSAPVVAKLIKSAAANATNNQKMDEASLYIKEIWVGPGKTLKRFMPKAKGSASRILKRTSHINVVVSDER